MASLYRYTTFARFGLTTLRRATGPAKSPDILLGEEEFGEPEGGNSFTRKTRPPRCSPTEGRCVQRWRGVPMGRLEGGLILVTAPALDSACREASNEDSHR